ncbi:MAG: MFS transporter [Candidatus Melainabacteria bacterium]|nr:MAG: MFS transporter [Candidatus Melainabacteria bacterium]
MFFANGAACASWAARIPDIQRLLSLEASSLGLSMFALGGGALLSMPVAGKLSARYGSGTVTFVLLLLLGFALVLAGNAGNFYELTVSLAFLGFCASAMDIAMNAQGVAVQRQLQRPIMSRLHALWSVGGMGGAAFGALMAKVNILPSHHFLYVAAFLIVLAVVARRYMIKKSVELSHHSEEAQGANGEQSGNDKGLNRAILLYCAICFFGFMCEGAIADWSALYLGKSLNTEAGFAALGYSAFSMAMAAGRFAGDHLIILVGRNNLLRYGSLLNAFVITLMLLLKSPWLALCGFVLVGFGLCTLAPIVYGTVSDLARSRVATSLANVAFAGYFGMLIGPPLLGMAAQFFGFAAPLALVAALSLLVFILASVSGDTDDDTGEELQLEQVGQSAI